MGCTYQTSVLRCTELRYCKPTYWSLYQANRWWTRKIVLCTIAHWVWCIHWWYIFLGHYIRRVIAGHRHKLPTVEPPRPLLEDLQFGPLANFQRSLAGAGFAASGLRGTQSYGTNFGSGMSWLQHVMLLVCCNYHLQMQCSNATGLACLSVCLSVLFMLESVNVETSFSILSYIVRISRWGAHGNVICSRSGSQERNGHTKCTDLCSVSFPVIF